jgi:hypothetical protein
MTNQCTGFVVSVPQISHRNSWSEVIGSDHVLELLRLAIVPCLPQLNFAPERFESSPIKSSS